GEAGDDTLTAGFGRSTNMIGGAGNDLLDGVDTYDNGYDGYARYIDEGGPYGIDVVFTAAGIAKVNDTFNDGTLSPTDSANTDNVDTLRFMSEIAGTNLADTLLWSNSISGVGPYADGVEFRPFGGNDFIDVSVENFDILKYNEDVNYGGTDPIIVFWDRNDNTGSITDPWGSQDDGFGIVLDPFGDVDLFRGIDRIRGTLGDDWALGDSGDNQFQMMKGADYFDGADGFDTVDMRAAGGLVRTSGVVVDLIAGTVDDGFGNTATVLNVEGARGTDLDDTLLGTTGYSVLRGEAGDDILDGRGGAFDWSQGGDGADTFAIGRFDRFTDSDQALTIDDFELGTDFIGLTDGLTFADLSFEQSGADTLIYMDIGATTTTRYYLGNLLNVDAAALVAAQTDGDPSYDPFISFTRTGVPNSAPVVEGVMGTAASFGGTASDYSAGYVTNIPDGDFTAAFWLRDTAYDQGGVSGGQETYFKFAGEFAGDMTFYGGDTGTLVIDDEGTVIDTGIAIPRDDWHHFTVTYNAATGVLAVHVDGAATPSFSTNVGTGSSGTLIGSLTLGNTDALSAETALTGDLAEVGIWPTVLSASEIGNLANGDVEFAAQPPSYFYRWSEEDGAFRDLAGGSQDLATNGTVTTTDAPLLTGTGLTVEENSAVGTYVGTVVASDDEAGTDVRYSITGGNTGNAFAIDALTGIITVAAALDHETLGAYALTITVDDLSGYSNATVDKIVNIEVGDRNEPPVVSGTTDPDPVAEGDTGVPSPVTFDMADTFTASDVDDGDTPAVDPGSMTIAAATGSATTLISPFSQSGSAYVVDTGSYDFLNAGESGLFDVTFDVVSGPDTVSRSVQIEIIGANDAPATSGNTISGTEDTTYFFDATDFPFTDVDSGSDLAQLKIVTIASAGTIYLDGVEVSSNDVISRADIDAGLLTFSPGGDENGTGYATFNFAVSDGTAFSGAATMTIDIAPVDDPPPTQNFVGLADRDTTTSNYPSLILDENNDPLKDADGETVSMDDSSVGTFSTTLGGSVQILIDGTYSYTPPTGYSPTAEFTDTFDYTLISGTLTTTNTYTMIVNGAPVPSTLHIDIPLAAGEEVILPKSVFQRFTTNPEAGETIHLTGTPVAVSQITAIALTGTGADADLKAVTANPLTGSAQFTYDVTDGRWDILGTDAFLDPSGSPSQVNGDTTDDILVSVDPFLETTMTGGDGDDQFVIGLRTDKGPDIITDYNQSGGYYDFYSNDLIDLSLLLDAAFDPQTVNVADYIQATYQAVNGSVALNVAAAGDGNFETVATLTGDVFTGENIGIIFDDFADQVTVQVS
ncbi:MAG: cadherin domain-containing protein, partial [Rhodobiaceae bacterium]|nr:cadherin domain-containing protein [Rhodobiaceae bacterium]